MMGKINPARAVALVAMITFGLYLSLLRAPFLNWDDDSNIFANPYFLAGQWRVFWTQSYFGLWVPVTSTIWQILFTLGGGAAWPFRILNATLHVANVWLVWRFADRFNRRLGIDDGWGAAMAATVFALHPLQTQAVAWISGGRDLLATFLALVALETYFRGGRTWRAGATVAFVLACLSKPSVVVLPLVVMVLQPSLAPGESKRTHALRLVPWLLLGLAVVARTFGAQAEHLESVAWWRRPWLMGDAFWFYESRVFEVLDLTPNYARTPAVVFAETASLAKAGLGFLLLGIAAASRRVRPLVVSWALFLLPVSGVVSFGYQRISGVADHYAYPAMAMLATTLVIIPWRSKHLALALLISIAFTICVYEQLAWWRSNAAFFGRMAQTAPHSYVTAIGMSTVACAERGQWAEGVRWTEVALRERPRDVRALANQAYCHFHAGDTARIVGLEAELDELDRAELARTQPTGYASLIASIGAAKIQRADYLSGFRLLCEARTLFPGAPVYEANVAAAKEILARQGLEPKCE